MAMDFLEAIDILKMVAEGNPCNRAVMGQEEMAQFLLQYLNRQWISAEEQKPKSEQRVFVHYKNECDKDRTEIAQYIAPFTVKANEFLQDDYDHSCSEYNEADDEFYVVEGWWESSWEADTNWKISREIDYWMPLPKFSREGKNHADQA